MCEKQPLECSFFSSSQCTDSYVNSYCPSLCGKCNGATATTTTLTTTKSSSCSSLYPCLNGGTFSLQNCSCICMPSYKGLLCETLMCDKQPIECNSFTTSQCSTSSIASFCPVLCGKCSSATDTPNVTTTTTPQTVPTTSKIACTLYPCLNGGTFNTTSCSCQCQPAYVYFPLY